MSIAVFLSEGVVDFFFKWNFDRVNFTGDFALNVMFYWSLFFKE